MAKHPEHLCQVLKTYRSMADIGTNKRCYNPATGKRSDGTPCCGVHSDAAVERARKLTERAQRDNERSFTMTLAEPKLKPALTLDEETTTAAVSALRGVAYALEQSVEGAAPDVAEDKRRVADKLRTAAAYIDGLAPTIVVCARKAVKS